MAMALAQYTDTFWFPNGVLAANVQAVIFPRSSSTPATLWSNSAGTVSLANPTQTDASGILTFWAESGDYWVHLDSEVFPITVGMSQEQADLSTGVASGGELNVNGSNPAALDIGAVDGYVVNYLAGTQAEPVVTRVKTAAQTVALDASALTRTITWWLLDSSGTVVQQASHPTNTQRRTHIVLGLTFQAGGAIYQEQTAPVILPQAANQLVDLMDALGPFIISGGLISANGTNLKIDLSSGEVFARSFNHFAGASLTDDPHVSPVLAQAPAQWRYVLQNSTVLGALTDTLDVANYDNGGVLTAVGGGAGSSTIHRVWLFAANTASAQLVIQYGQTVYASLTDAVNAVGSRTHVVNPLLSGEAALVAQLAVTRTATNLSDIAQCRIIRAGKFDVP